MGKPFRREIEVLESTYSWACGLDVSNISKTLRSTWHLPLLSVGSGGSYSAAELHASLHRIFFQSVAQAVTPMDLISSLPRDGRASVWFMSASGNNVDIRRAFQHAALSEPKAVSALVGKESSKLASLASRYQYTNLYEYALPNGRDGFLATNSLLGFSTIMYRAYCKATDREDFLPNSLKELVANRIPEFDKLENILIETDKLWSQNTVHVIYSSRLKSTAVDIESKFIEAGLGSIHLADLRNFAHGRHHWFSKNELNNGILALTTPNDSDLGSKTLSFLPDDIPKSHISIQDINGSEMLVGLLLSIYFTHWRGEKKGIDPGRPGVPHYGSKIYRLTTNAGFIRSLPRNKIAIDRKTRYGPVSIAVDTSWYKAYRKYSKEISEQKFGCIVLDYDGTVIDSRKRKDPPSEEICEELTRLLELGLKIGFATGRGKSIREALKQPNMIPKKYWGQVIIGYYNGSDIGVLSDDNSPNGLSDCCKDLGEVVEKLNNSLFISSLDHKITSRRKQVTVEPTTAIPETFLWEVAQEQLAHESSLAAEIVRSSHSIDIIAKDVTKLAVVKRIRQGLDKYLQVLTIGDRGRWPGNDAALLSMPYSLSVDEVSYSKDSCWNLCAAGIKGPQGTLEYLKRINGEKGEFRFK